MKILNRQQREHRTQSLLASQLNRSSDNSAHWGNRSNAIDSMEMMKMTTLPKRSFLRSDPETLWRIEAGIVRTISFDEDGTVVVLGLWGVGDIIGQPYSNIDPFQIECLTRVKVTEIRSSNWQLKSQQLSDSFQQLEELTVIRGYRKVDRMLVKLLEWLYDRFGKMSAEGKSIDFKMTHQDIADITGNTRVAISRALKELKQQGAISCTRIEPSTKFNSPHQSKPAVNQHQYVVETEYFKSRVAVGF
jgi:CRP-like cAMP-binding protein